MPQRITYRKKNPLFVYDCLAVLVGAVFAVPFVLILALPLIADF